jgi:subtilisin family serine protease
METQPNQTPGAAGGQPGAAAGGPRKRVIAHYMHESEKNLVTPLLQNATAMPGFAIGDIDEDQMVALTEQGIIFQELGEAPRTAFPKRNMPEKSRVNMAFMGGLPTPVADLDNVVSNTYYLTLSGPLLPEWRQQLEALGVAFRVAVAGFRWVVRIAPPQVVPVRALPFVTDLKMREADRVLPTPAEMASLGSPSPVRDMIAYDVLLDKDASLDVFVAWLKQQGIAIAGAEANKARIYLLDNDPRLSEIAARHPDVVVDILPFTPPVLHNDRARVLLGVDATTDAAPGFPYSGETEIVGVADTGLDESHEDFAGRIHEVVALGRARDASDAHGHGTHVAGSILGSGAGSDGQFRGVAPAARLYFQSLLDNRGGLGGLPLRLQTLFQQAYRAGVRIHNNSWGAAAWSAYRLESREVDEFVHEHKDMLIVFSAGNEGTAAAPAEGLRSSADGFVDWLSLGAPATAKNALTVGASCSDRTSGGWAEHTYGWLRAANFGQPPVFEQKISGDPEAMAAFSSRGPCDDTRIKPDVVAPGTSILSCRSQVAPLRNFWGDPHSEKYAYMGGTSMSAPLVTGCAALVRQYYRQERGHQPSAALLKATLINSTQYLTGNSSMPEDSNSEPNYHQGFGKVLLTNAIPTPLNPPLRLEFYDDWEQPAEQLQITGDQRRFRFNLASAGELRICLAYTDLPGRALQNNLNLFLELPDGRKLFGNMQVPGGMKRPDAANNVEVIRMAEAPAGAYLIQVVASNLLTSQDFALVVAGRLAPGLVAV